MPGSNVKFRNSLVTRFALFFAGLNVLVILIVGYLVYHQAESVITSYSQDRMRHNAQLAIQSFTSLLSEVANDIAVTTENSLLQDYIAQPTATNIEDLNQLFSTLLRNKPNYFQIRLLDVTDDGKEAIRFDKQRNKIIQTPEKNLQFKGDRVYYREALKIPIGTYYYSEINLNEEFGKISLPHTPTLRAVGQVYDYQQELQALLVINVDLTGFYNELSQIMEVDDHLFLVNDAGDYLFASDTEKCFGRQLKTGNSFYTDFRTSDSLFTNLNLGSIQDNQQNQFQYYWETINYSPGQRFHLVNMQEDSLLFRSAYFVRNYSIKLVVIVSLVSLLLAFLFVSVFSKRIKRITEAVVAYEEDLEKPSPTLFPASRQDELGILARAFVRMRKRIDSQLYDLKSALAREQEAIVERDLFLQNMGHELRTPLNAILGLTRLLSKNNPRDSQKPITSSLERSARNLSGLVHDILDHQKLREGKVYLNLTPNNFQALLTDIFSVYRYEAINKGLTFHLEVSELLQDKTYLTDQLRFNQVITNLVVNAIKFTSSGSITLKANIIEPENSRIKIEIIDTGKGIRPENLKRIKERFYQENQGTPVDEKGYGLGLSIVKQLIDLFQGQLEVSSNVGTGSSFTVYLPLIPVDPNTVSKPSHNEPYPLPQLTRKYTVLHLEDDASNLLLLSHLLEIPGITLKQVDSTDHVTNILLTDPPDLIISDMMLYGQQIDSFLLELEKKDIPLLLLSAFNPTRMKAIGNYFLQKPFDNNELLDLVIMLIGQREYDIPHLNSTYEQYDQRPDKISNYLSILIQEFEYNIRQFKQVFESQNIDEWNAILHKLTTHIKSLKLERLAKAIPEDPRLVKNQGIDIINHLLYCLVVFRCQLRKFTPSSID